MHGKSVDWFGSAEVVSYLDGELLLLTPETSPYVGLHLAWGCLPQQPHQQDIAGRPSQVLAELTKDFCQVIMDAHHMLLTCCCLSEVRDQNAFQEPALTVDGSAPTAIYLSLHHYFKLNFP